MKVLRGNEDFFFFSLCLKSFHNLCKFFICLFFNLGKHLRKDSGEKKKFMCNLGKNKKHWVNKKERKNVQGIFLFQVESVQERKTFFLMCETEWGIKIKRRKTNIGFTHKTKFHRWNKWRNPETSSQVLNKAEIISRWKELLKLTWMKT